MKTFSAEALAALASGDVIVSGAVRFALPEPVRFWGGHGPLVLPVDGVSEAFIGVGDRGMVNGSSGTIGGGEIGATLELSGVDPDVAGNLGLEELRGVRVIIWRLIFSGSGARLLHAAVFLRGRVDDAPIEETKGGTSIIRVTVEGAARGLGRRSERMRSDADQRLIRPTDGGLSRVIYAGDKQVTWGGQPPIKAGAAMGANGPGGNGSIGGGSNIRQLV